VSGFFTAVNCKQNKALIAFIQVIAGSSPDQLIGPAQDCVSVFVPAFAGNCKKRQQPQARHAPREDRKDSENRAAPSRR
jgi:hypothetical protein